MAIIGDGSHPPSSSIDPAMSQQPTTSPPFSSTGGGCCRVNLFLSDPMDDEEIRRAQSVCEILSTRYGVYNVVLRSSLVVVSDERSEMETEDEAELYVFLESSTSPSSTTKATRAYAERVSPYPVLAVDPSAGSEDAAALVIAKFCSLSCPDVRQRVRKALRIKNQADWTADAHVRTSSSPLYTQAIAKCYDAGATVTGDSVTLPGRIRGKVRDRYELDHQPGQQKQPLAALVTTDRQSGFDRMLAQVPYKGAVLNLTSAFWFHETAHIIPNHLVSVPHPYVSIVRKCTPFPIEFVVRSYMTGSTSTSIWKNYQDGVRNYCGHDLPDHMVKNQKLAQTLLTPTTKEEHHDRPISVQEIVDEKWMTQADLDVCASAALRVFALGQEIAARHGLILVDTKYEFGKDSHGNILLIDEVHTPDSSRYWLSSTYEERMAQGKEPDNIDKEFLRLWFRDHCDPYKDEVLPDAPRDLVLELSRRYITLYEMITGKTFRFDIPGEYAIAQVIQEHLV